MATTIIQLVTEAETLPPPPPPTDGNGELVHFTQMALTAKNRLISYFRRGPRNRAFLDGVVSQVQDLEDSSQSLYLLTRLPYALGVNLDVLGRIVGELRAGRADEDYRAAIRTRILVNASDGKTEQLIAIVLSILPTTTVGIAEYSPPALSITVGDLGSVTPDTMYRMLFQAKAAGVRLELTYGVGTIGADDDTYLGGTMGSDDDTTLGFAMSSTY